MTAVTASMVKELRDKTGAGMMDCKTALTETNGDMEEAVDWLRKKGLSKAANKADRVAAEGLIGVTAKDKSGAIVEVNSETDFVARNRAVPGHGARHHLAGAEGRRRPGQAAGHALSRARALTVEEHVKEMVATIGENMSVRRTAARRVQRRRGRRVRAQQGRPTASARSACWWRSRARATRRRSRRSAASSPCTLPRPARRPSAPTSSTRR